MCHALDTAAKRGRREGEKTGMQKAFDLMLELREYIKKAGCSVDDAIRAKNIPEDMQQSVRMVLS